MQVVARPFEPAWGTADFGRKVKGGLVGIAGAAGGFALAPLRIFVNSTAIRTARHITHAAAKLHRIRRNHSFLVCRYIAENYLVLSILGEGECAEVNPCAATHLLVDTERSCAALVMDSI